MALAADIAGLIGSLLLLFPALRIAELLRQSHRVTEVARDSEGENARLGFLLGRILEGYTRTWNPRDYWALLDGMLRLFFSFVLGFLSHL